jgi:arabinose-5-phosphate isomerase
MKPALHSISDDLTVARKVIEVEINGLQALSQSLGEPFLKALSLIQAMKDKQTGRLILAGIGKSGHIAKKITATLASTGTPSYYIHAGEASHGDLGMITDRDVVILISNSGESAELVDLIHFTRRFSIPLIAITANPNGALAQHSDCVLLLPKMPEACPNGLAPTTSTTMTLALGDAIAIALLQRQGLTPDQFRVFHPGGKLGAKLKKVSDFMVSGADLPIVDAATKMDQAIITLAEKNLGSVVVCDQAQLVLGIITDGDLKRHMSADLLSRPVSDIMNKNPLSISAQALAVEALETMLHAKASPITSLLVVEDKKLVGLIRIQELLKAGLM